MALTPENLADSRLREELDNLALLDNSSVAWWRSETFDHRQHGADNAIMLLSAAERARSFARSWRDFRVGAAALAIYEGGGLPAEYRLIHGANFKPNENSGEVNIHAEDILKYRATEAAQPGQQVDISTFAVVGDVQPDQQSSVITDTLHPCGLCRDSFMEPGSPIGPDSLALTANSGFTTFEWFTVAALRAYHLGVLMKDEALGGVTFSSRPASLAGRGPDDYRSRGVQYEKPTPEIEVANQEVLQRLQVPISLYARIKAHEDSTLTSPRAA